MCLKKSFNPNIFKMIQTIIKHNIQYLTFIRLYDNINLNQSIELGE